MCIKTDVFFWSHQKLREEKAAVTASTQKEEGSTINTTSTRKITRSTLVDSYLVCDRVQSKANLLKNLPKNSQIRSKRYCQFTRINFRYLVAPIFVGHFCRRWATLFPCYLASRVLPSCLLPRQWWPTVCRNTRLGHRNYYF